jgi:NTP pyrophosphatase (non-canonical NTP hydrolase)
MKVTEYDEFVRRTDQSKARSVGERRAISLYGLVGEIGSLLSAIKKKILSESGDVAWDQPSEEIKEELGDVLWYCYALAHVENGGSFDILRNDIELLKQEIGASNERGAKIRAALDPSSREAFLAAAETFPPASDYAFNDYQTLAFKTARTDGRTLLEVCLAVLTQLAAELLHKTLPEIELTLNTNIANRPCNTVLGEVTWHLAAIASLHHLTLDEVVSFNTEKVGFRAERGTPTALHDEGRPPHQQLPRMFEIAFVRIGPGKSRMYFEGRPLGDPLTDQTSEDDGYRFHDVMHLALVAHLGWSPVIRGFMRRKRPDIDEVEDAGRAKVVEELVLKAIHSEGERQSRAVGRCQVDGPKRLFPVRSTIPFSLLKTVRGWVQGLEVWKNTYWEWEDAIYTGCEIFSLLRAHKQGTVQVDLLNRRATFKPVVSANVSGVTVGLGMASLNEGEAESILAIQELGRARAINRVADTGAAKKALLQALSLSLTAWDQLDIDLLPGNQISVKASGHAQDRIWAMGVIDFKVAFAVAKEQSMLCSAMAIADLGSQSR